MESLTRIPESTGLRVAGDALPAALRPFVREIYEERLEAPPGGGGVCISGHVDPFLHVIFSGTLDVRLSALGFPPFRVPPSTISGPLADAYEIEVQGVLHGFYARFTPVGPLALLGVRGYGLTAQGAPPLGALVRPGLEAAVAAWEQALRAAPDFAARAALAEGFFLDRLAARTDAEADEAAFLLAAVAALERGGGRVGAVADELGVSAATLRRRFAVLGVGVKTFAALVRFQRTHAFLFTTPGATWADAAALFGYADQAHLVRDHRRFGGVPPTRWDRDERIVDRRMGIEGDYDGPVAGDHTGG